jgi:hypothetical protein
MSHEMGGSGVRWDMAENADAFMKSVRERRKSSRD